MIELKVYFNNGTKFLRMDARDKKNIDRQVKFYRENKIMVEKIWR